MLALVDADYKFVWTDVGGKYNYYYQLFIMHKRLSPI